MRRFQMLSVLSVLFLSGVATGAAEDPSPARLASPLPVAAIVPAPPPEAIAIGGCVEAVAEADLATRSGARIEEKAANAFHARMHSAARTAECADRLVALVRASDCSGNATGILASAVFASPATSPDAVAGAVERAVDLARSGKNSCARSVIPAVQQANRIEPRLRAALSRAAHASDPSMSEAGWLLLGSAESIARAGGDQKLAASIDDEIAAAVGPAVARHASTRATLLEAAGNGGCRGCARAVAAAETDSEPWVRRAAVGARRFVPGSARATCQALGDSSATVREQAAWALGFAEAEDEGPARRDCLTRAAAGDASEDVRKAAEHSLAGLTDRSAPEVAQ